jgi:hypothetical protein
MSTVSFFRHVLRLAGVAIAASVLTASSALLPAVPLQASNSPAAVAAGPASPDDDVGVIAYVDRNTASLRVVNADGSNNHVLWTNPHPHLLPINLDWRHDGLELAFSSPHEDTCSQFDRDIYAVHLDGTSYRRVTNAPTCAELAPLPKGSITVDVTVSVATFVYVPGAPGIVGAVNGIMTIDNIADFGPEIYQQPVVIMGLDRQLADPPFPDIIPGQTVPGGVIIVNDDSGYRYGAGSPSWRADDSSIAYNQRSNSAFNNIPANPDYGDDGDPLPVVEGASEVLVDWNPTLAGKDQYLYYSTYVHTDAAHGIWLHDLNDPTQCRRLYHPAAFEYSPQDIEWLPDGSGFLFVLWYTGWLDPNGYTCPGTYENCRNIFKYDLATGQVTQLTNFSDKLTQLVSVSSDGQSIIFERWTDPDLDVGSDLWIMNGDGSNPHLFLQDAARPAWFGPGGNPLAMAPFVTIDHDDIGIYLNWDDFEINVGGYKVRHSEKPYFQPNDENVTTVDLEPGTEGWIHENAEGDPAHNHYYFVQGVGAEGATSGPSNRTGGFNFGLTPGS